MKRTAEEQERVDEIWMESQKRWRESTDHPSAVPLDDLGMYLDWKGIYVMPMFHQHKDGRLHMNVETYSGKRGSVIAELTDWEAHWLERGYVSRIMVNAFMRWYDKPAPAATG